MIFVIAAEPLTPLLTAGAADVVLLQVRTAIARRAFCYRNQPRTALMLELMRLRLNRVDDETTYAHDIRANLDAGVSSGACSPYGTRRAGPVCADFLTPKSHGSHASSPVRRPHTPEQAWDVRSSSPGRC